MLLCGWLLPTVPMDVGASWDIEPELEGAYTFRLALANTFPFGDLLVAVALAAIRLCVWLGSSFTFRV